MLIKRRTRPLTEDQWLSRMSCEFAALPGLSLTMDQARRLWGLEPQSCQRLLSRLVKSGILSLTPDGTYRRASRMASPARPDARRCA